MANLKKGNNNKVVAKNTLDIEGSGLTPDNCEVIWEVGDAPKSWRYNSKINGLTKFTAGNTYNIRCTKDVVVANL